MNILTKSGIFLAFFLAAHVMLAQNSGGEDCASATDIGTPGGPQTCPGGSGFEGENTDSAAVATFNPSCDQIGNNNDLWYKFTAPASGGVQLVVECITALRIEAAVYDACGGNEVICNESHSDGLMVMGLIPGQTYYLQLWSDAFVAGEFNFCVFEKQGPPPNDTCAGAVALPIQMNNNPCEVVSGNVYNNYGTTASGALPNPSCSNFGQGRDIWYQLDVPASGSVTVEMTSAIGPQDWAMSAYTGDCGSLTELECDDDDGTGLLPKLELNGLTPGTTVYFRIFEFGGDEFGSFELIATEESTTPPSNDNCGSAIDITSSLVLQGDCIEFCGHNINSTPSGELPLPGPGCGAFGGGNDIWYTAIAPATGAMAIELTQHMTSGPQDWAMAAYRGTCGALSFIDCDDDSGVSLYPSLILPTLTPGERIYIRIWEFQGNDEGSFNICAKGFNPLAVELLNFYGQAMEEGNAISWTVLETDNIENFVVESRGEKDIEWQAVSNVEAETTQREYEIMDKNVKESKYYRLKSYETTGEMNISEAIFVNRKAAEIRLSVYPNPAKDNINLYLTGRDVTRREDIKVNILTTNGTMITTYDTEIFDGRLKLNIEDLPSGVYLIHVNAKNTQWSEKIVID